MIKYIVLLSLFFSLGVQAQADRGPYHYSLDQGINERSLIIDTKTFERKEKDIPFSAERFNAKNVINFLYGLQHDEFEEKKDYLLEILPPRLKLLG